MTEKNNLSLWNRWADVPDAAKKEIKGGRLSGMTDINPMWRYKVLTEIFGPCGIGWYINNEKYELHEGAKGQIVATCSLKLNYREPETGEWAAPIPGQGGSMLVVEEKNGLRTNDEAFKMAYTDAVSVACKQLGIGADVYWARGGDSKYSSNDQPGRPAQRMEAAQAKINAAHNKRPQQQVNTDDDPLGQAVLCCEKCGKAMTRAVYNAVMKQFGHAVCQECRNNG